MTLKRRSAVRAGTILPLIAVSLVALVGLIAMAIDIGVLTVARTQAQNSADLSALVGARLLNGDTSDASNLNNINTAIATAQNRADDNNILLQSLTPSQIQTRVGIYSYDSTAQKFVASYPSSPGANAWSVMEVTLTGSSPTYFGKVFNINSFTVKTQATAAHRPRDIALILDFSGSMKFGTESGFYTSGSGSIRGSLNGDPIYPKFGPY